MTTEQRTVLADLARASDDVAEIHRDAAEAACDEIDRLVALAADLAESGQALLDAAKVGERTFWNATQLWMAVYARYKGAKAHPSNPYT